MSEKFNPAVDKNFVTSTEMEFPAAFKFAKESILAMVASGAIELEGTAILTREPSEKSLSVIDKNLKIIFELSKHFGDRLGKHVLRDEEQKEK